MEGESAHTIRLAQDIEEKWPAIKDLLKRAGGIMSFHAGRCPMNIPNNYSGCEEHLAEYRDVQKAIKELLAAVTPSQKG